MNKTYLIFNYSKEVSAYASSSSVNDCDCSYSKFCYEPHGHIITGNLDIVKKGPKYRISSDIDFDLCNKELADGLLKYSKHWCVREGVDAYVLHPWLLKISQLVHNRINFFVTNPLMIPKYKISLTSSIKKALRNIHEKYVLVPADKAANNVIVI